MNKKTGYAGIDYFRIIAAFLVVAIHTSPLVSFSETGDFILTRVAARVAVPFFFMTSGFFLISRYGCNNEKLWRFIKNTAIIYAVAIFLYIPINIYNGYFKMNNIMPNIIKDIFFDGTLYHLWYLPASITGALIAWFLVKKLNYKKALAISFILYFIGLFGDSYYGITEKIPVLNIFYRLIFQISDYTRNGIFFAPVFFVAGGLIADKRPKISFKKSVFGFCISFVLMFWEALVLHLNNVQKHDSMYIFLLPAMYFLFNAILHFRGKRFPVLRTSSLIIYIIHPLMIVIIRLFAKIFHLENLLIENSIIHYFMVCLSSAVAGIILTIMWNKFKPEKFKKNYRSYIEINLKNLEHNVNELKKIIPRKCELMAVIKAEAYGHGMYEIATFINKVGVKAFAAATIDEAIKLRKCGISGEILILGYTEPDRAKELYKYDLTQTLTDYEYACHLNGQKYKVKAHIKIDTGMHRLGFDKINNKIENRIENKIKELNKISDTFSMKNIEVTGIYTHLCAADSSDENDILFTYNQIESFNSVINLLKSKGIKIPKTHVQSSYGLLNYPELEYDYVRAGVSLYGVLSSPADKTKLNPDLRPVLSLKSKVILLRNIKKGERVGYSRTFTADRDSQIAVLPIGYADGYPRNLSCTNSYVLINGQKAPVIGRVCMDQLIVDVTDIQDVAVEMPAILIGKDQNEEISAEMVAYNSGSITNELLSRMGQRLEIKYRY